MKAQEDSSAAEKEIVVKMVIEAWDAQNSKVDKLLEELSDEQLRAENAPGKNTGVYLLGHLTAVSDGLLPILGLSRRLYPQLEEVFLKNPEKSGLEKPSIAELKTYWREVNAKIREYFKDLRPEDWFGKHVAISAEDFAREPHRNKLNVLLSRTNHQSYHLGQLIYLREK
jgi:hypothetical protein